MSLAALRRYYDQKSGGPKPQEQVETYSGPTLVIKNSFCSLYNIPKPILNDVEAALTYKNESVAQEKIRCFRLLSMAKRQGKRSLTYKLMRTLEELDRQETVCWLRGDKFPTGHLHLVRAVFEKHGLQPKELDRRVIPSRRYDFEWVCPQHPLRYYQAEMADLAIQGEQARGVFVASVGSGKTRVAAELIQRLGVPTLVIVPSTALLEQLAQGFEDAFGCVAVERVQSAKVKKALARNEQPRFSPIRIATIQTLASLKKSKALKPVLNDVDLVIMDEFHHAGAESFTQLLPELDHVYYRFGFTGTFTRTSKLLDMLGVLSNVLYSYPPKRATQEGFLTPVEFLIHPLPGRRCSNYQQEYAANYCGGEALLRQIVAIFDQYVLPTEQVLILVNRKDTAGLLIHELLNELGIENAYVSGDDKKSEVAETIRRFNAKEIRVLVGSTILGEGVDLYSTDRLILARGGKSEVEITQALGRAVRLAPGKTRAYIHDFRFEGTKFMERHLQQRLDLYRESFGGSIKEIGSDAE